MFVFWYVTLTRYSASILTVADLVLQSPADIAKRCRIQLYDAQVLLNTVCDALAPELHSLANPALLKDETFTTGDPLIDSLFGGGIRTGKLWEVVGERCAILRVMPVHQTSSNTQCSRENAARDAAFSLCPASEAPWWCIWLCMLLVNIMDPSHKPSPRDGRRAPSFYAYTLRSC